MLVLTRRPGESLCFYPKGREGDNEVIVEVTTLAINGNQIRLGIKGSLNITVHRKEIYERILLEKRMMKKAI